MGIVRTLLLVTENVDLNALQVKTKCAERILHLLLQPLPSIPSRAHVLSCAYNFLKIWSAVVQAANVGDFLAATMVETGRLQIMQTLVGLTDHMSVQGSHMGQGSQVSLMTSQAGMYSVYKRNGRSSSHDLSIMAAASNISNERLQGVLHEEHEVLPGARSSPARTPSNLSSTVGAAVHRILPHDDSVNDRLSAGDAGLRSSTEEERPPRDGGPPSQKSADMPEKSQGRKVGVQCFW